jgi:Fe-S-cluster containining protein
MTTSQLQIIQSEVQSRVQSIDAGHEGWPCRKGCDECCRSLASVPRVSQAEWRLIADALRSLPAEIGNLIRKRIEGSRSSSRPVVCPLLDTNSGACSVYEARPVACRAYGFYVERHDVLGCHRIEAIARDSVDVIWGNHVALEEKLTALGPRLEFHAWQACDEQQD